MEFDKEDYSIKMSLKILISVSLFLYFAFSQPSIVWVKEYDSGFNDYAQAVAANNSGNIIVTGASYNGTDFDCLTIKYSASGDTLWTRRFDTGGSDIAKDVKVDNSGNIIVVGSSQLDTIYDYLIIKYDNSGDFIWMRRYQSTFDNIGMAVDIDDDQNIVITGYSYNGNNYDYLTIKYTSSGDTIWSRRYEAGSNDIANDVAIDDENNVIVTGSSYDLGIPAFTSLTIKYNLSGDSLWTRQYIHWANFDLYGYCVSSDANNNIITAAGGYFGVFYIVKYTTTGDTVWILEKQWYDVYTPRDITVDSTDNIIITGEHKKQENLSYNFRTGKFTTDGDSIWRADYQDGWDDPDEFACGITVDLSGNIIVTGYADNDNDYDYLTVKYTEEGAIVEKIRMPAAVKGFEVYSPYPNPFKSQTQIKYSLAKNACIKIDVYDISGRKVKTLIKGNQDAGYYRLNWDADDDDGKKLSKGVYFIHFEAKNETFTKKIVMVK